MLRRALPCAIFLLCHLSLTVAKAENEQEEKVINMPQEIESLSPSNQHEAILNLAVSKEDESETKAETVSKKTKSNAASEKPNSKDGTDDEASQSQPSKVEKKQPQVTQEKPDERTTELDKLKEDALKAANVVGDVIKNAAENAANALNVAADGATTATKAVANSVSSAVQNAEQQIQTERLIKEEAKAAEVSALAEGKRLEQAQPPQMHPWIQKAQEVVNGIAAGTAKAYEAVLQATGQQYSTGEQGGQQQTSEQKAELASVKTNPDRVIDPMKDASISRQVPRISEQAQNIAMGSKVSELSAQALAPIPSPMPSPSPSPGHWTDRLTPTAVPEAYTRYVAAKTFITWQDVLRGQKRLSVRSTVGFELLFPIRINEGGLNHEDNIIVDTTQGLKLKSPLKYSHGLGEEVKMLNPLDSNYVEPTPSKLKEQTTKASKIFSHLGKSAVGAAGSPTALVGVLLGVSGVGYMFGYAANLMQGKRGVRALPGVGRLVRAGGLQKYSQY